MTRYIVIILLIGLVSCSSFNGRIEVRDNGCDTTMHNSKKVFLVNKSINKKYRFTVKVTETINERKKSYRTSFITLEPGDEIFLGCDSRSELLNFPTKRVPIRIDSIVNFENKSSVLCTYNDSILKYNLDWKIVYNNQEVPLVDVKEAALMSGMNINEYLKKTKMLIEIPESSVEYNDSLNAYPRKTLWLNVEDTTKPRAKNIYEYEFNLTGQVELKNTGIKTK